MANPLWFLGGLYLWNRLSRQERIAKENTRRLAELEKLASSAPEEQPLVDSNTTSENNGCLGCLVILLAVPALYGLFFTEIGWGIMIASSCFAVIAVVFKKFHRG